MSERPTCPDCGEALPPGSPRGLCPRCLLRAGLRSGTGSVPRPDGPAVTGDVSPTEGGGVLETLAAANGSIPRVVLRDTDGGDEPPLHRPARGDEPGHATRYRIDGEIARGGMGEVLKGRDPDLGRDVAVKVLREDLRENSDMVRRFVEEAQIGGQLQHPGIVPIYELGTFADRRPFFAMKLVKGDTLAQLLGARKGPGDELPRFLAIFESIAQTVAYSHARGVIHRDLKPSNVMVGSFGEVQVMDWGLAKILPRGGIVDDEKSGKVTDQETVIATARSGSADTDLSRAGSAMGTPSYMAPEQARGEVERIDERADVFALGSILCEVLTGRPAFLGRTSLEILLKARQGELGDALARLDGCGADAELIAMAKDCLASEPGDRPRAALAVAARTTAYLAGVQEKLRRAELDRVEERSRRRLTTLAAAALLIVTTMIGLGATYFQRQSADRAAMVARVVGEASTLRYAARPHPEDVAPWRTAMAAVHQAEGVADGDPQALRQLAEIRDEVRAGAEAAERDRALLDRLVDVRSARSDDPEGVATEAGYAETFREAGIDLATLPPAEAGARIKARPPGVALAIASALDDWAASRRFVRRDAAGAGRLTEVTRAADPDPWRNGLRDALALADKARRKGVLKALAEKALADTAGAGELAAVSLDLLGKAMHSVGEPAAAEAVLRRAQRRHPGDVWINYDLAVALAAVGRRDDAIRFYTAARAVRPETAHELAHALARRHESDEAIEVFEDLDRLQPGDGRHLTCLGIELKNLGRKEEAAEVLERALTPLREAIRISPGSATAHSNLGRALDALGKHADAVAEAGEAVRLQPDSAASHSNLGVTLVALGKRAEAIAAFREAIRLQPDLASAHAGLGNALAAQRRLDAAIAEFREAIRLEPDEAGHHNNLGVYLNVRGEHAEAVAECREAIRLDPMYGAAYCNLGIGLGAQGKHAEAVAALREAIRLDPDSGISHSKLGVALGAQGKHAEALAAHREAIRVAPNDAGCHNNLGVALATQGKRAEAIAEYREAVRLAPDNIEGHINLGIILTGTGQLDEAVAECREAIRLRPDDVRPYYNLGHARVAQRKPDEAVAAYRAAIRVDPGFAEAHCNLGELLGSLGQFDEALAQMRQGHELGSKRPAWPYPSAQWVAHAERMAALSRRLPAVLRGDDHPKGQEERLALAGICYSQKRYAVAVRFWAEALEAEPGLGNDRRNGHRYNAACAASLGASGEDRGDPPPDDAQKTKLRGQALGWLKAELATWKGLLASGPPGIRPAVVQTLNHWKQDKDLAANRDAGPMSRIPEAERKEWQALWSEVEMVLDRARQAP